jgi:branched-chain amino acid transport system permease protein
MTSVLEVTATDPVDRPSRFDPGPAGRLARMAVLAGIGLAVLTLPVLMGPITANVFSRVATFVLVALSLNILIGYTGQVSLGHSAFLGVGAFTSGWLLTEARLPWVAAVIGAIVVGGAMALVIGFVSLRVKGLYLALVTLVYAVFAERVLFSVEAITRGGAGMPADRPAWLSGDVTYAYLCLGAVVLVWWLDRQLTISKAGRAIEAIRDSEQVAASWGINVTAFKLFAFVLSGAIAGLAGALFASVQELVTPADFPFLTSLLFLLMAIFGGVGSRPGVVLGAVTFSSMPFVLDRLSAQFAWFPFDGSAEALVTALLVLLILLYAPGGLAQVLRPVFRWLSFGPWRAPVIGAVPGLATGGDDAHS